MMKNQKSQLGIGLLELMLSIAIIAVLLIMATRYYVTSSQASRVNQAIEAYNGLAAAAENWSQANDGSYEKLDLTVADTNGWIPHALVSSKTALNTPWGPATIIPSASDVQIDFPSAGNVPKDLASLRAKLCGATDTTSTKYSVITQKCSVS